MLACVIGNERAIAGMDEAALVHHRDIAGPMAAAPRSPLERL